MNSKTVLHIFSGDLWAGAEVMIFNLLSSLRQEAGLKIIALALNEGVLSARLRGAGIETHVIREDRHSFLSISIRAHNLLKDKKIDVVHSHRYKENFLAIFLSKTLGINRLITTVHGLPEPLAKDNHLSLKTSLDYYLLNRHFSSVVAVSHDVKRELSNRYQMNSNKIEVIHNGISFSQEDGEKGRLPNREFHIGAVGRMVPVKDFDLFLEIVAKLKKQVKFIRCSILGDGTEKVRLIGKAKELGISEAVDFFTPVQDPFPYYRSLDLYLNTSVHEGIPLSILEAMSSSKPVVASWVGGIPEIISDGEDGFLIKGRNPDLFVKRCLQLISDIDLRQRISNAACTKIERDFNSSKMAQCYSRLYHA